MHENHIGDQSLASGSEYSYIICYSGMYVHKATANQISSYNCMGTVKDSYKLKSIQHGQVATTELPSANGCIVS